MPRSFTSSRRVPAACLRGALAASLGLLLAAGVAMAGELPTPENSGANNYLRPVPPGLVEKQLESKRRLDAQLQAEELRKAKEAAEAKARAAAAPPPPQQPEPSAMPGYMYR